MKGRVLVVFGALALAGFAGGAAASQLRRPAPLAARALDVALEVAQPAHAPAAPIAPRVVVPDSEVAPADAFGADVSDGLLVTGATPHRIIHFTFDDGPDRRTTPELLDRLDAAGIKATFFLTARRIAGTIPAEREQIEVARETLRRGHVVANHTVDHAALPMLDNAGVLAQVEGTEAIFLEQLGARPWLIRPPYGVSSPRVNALLAARGYTVVFWNLGTGDFMFRTAEDVFRVFQKKMAARERETGDRGGIILLHDTHAWSVDAFQLIYDFFRARNCELLAQGEELYDFVDDLRYFYTERAGADPSEEAPPALLPPDVFEARQRRLREETSMRCGAPTELAGIAPR